MSEKIPSATELIAERIKSDSFPGQRDDPYKLGIIIQGGAMKGVIGGGGANGLEAVIGNSEPFDEADVTSGGAFNWLFLESRKTSDGVTLYYEELSKNFIAYKNRLSVGRFINMSIPMEAVSQGPKSLDFQRIIHHPSETNVYATSVEDAKEVTFKLGQAALISESNGEQYEYLCQTDESIKKALEATSHLPWWAGKPVELPDGTLCVDGGLSAGRVPLQKSLANDCTHVLVISTDRRTSPDEYKKRPQEKIAALGIRKKHRFLSGRYWAGFESHRDVLRILGDAEVENPARIEVIRVEDKFVPSSVETNPRKLFQAAIAGRLAVLEAFKRYNLQEDQSVMVRHPRQL